MPFGRSNKPMSLFSRIVRNTAAVAGVAGAAVAYQSYRRITRRLRYDDLIRLHDGVSSRVDFHLLDWKEIREMHLMYLDQPDKRWKSALGDVQAYLVPEVMFGYHLVLEKYDNRGWLIERKTLWQDGNTHKYETAESCITLDVNGDEVIGSLAVNASGQPSGTANF